MPFSVLRIDSTGNFLMNDPTTACSNAGVLVAEGRYTFVSEVRRKCGVARWRLPMRCRRPVSQTSAIIRRASLWREEYHSRKFFYASGWWRLRFGITSSLKVCFAVSLIISCMGYGADRLVGRARRSSDFLSRLCRFGIANPQAVPA